MADRLFDRGGLRDQVREGETPSRSHPREDVTPRRCVSAESYQ